jgi:hypothetical protein
VIFIYESFELSQENAFLAERQPKLPKQDKPKKKNTQTVRKQNPLSNARKKPSFFKTVRKPNFPKHETKNIHSFNLQKRQTSRSVKPKIFILLRCKITKPTEAQKILSELHNVKTRTRNAEFSGSF